MFRNKWMQKFVAGAMVAAMTLSITAMSAMAASTTTIVNNGELPAAPILTQNDGADAATDGEVLGVDRPVEAPADTTTPAATDTIGNGNAGDNAGNAVNAGANGNADSIGSGSGSDGSGSSVLGAARDNASGSKSGTASAASAGSEGAVLGATRTASVALGGEVLGAGRSPKTADGSNSMLVMMAIACFAGAGALVAAGKNRA